MLILLTAFSLYGSISYITNFNSKIPIIQDEFFQERQLESRDNLKVHSYWLNNFKITRTTIATSKIDKNV